MKYANSDVFEFYKTNLEDSLINEQLKNKLLEPYDIVTIRRDPFFTLQKKVNIVGEVLYPGRKLS